MRQVILSCDEFTDDELVVKLRSYFSHVPAMNEAREELRNMRQMGHESISVYMYGGDELYIDHQEFDPMKRDISM